jgi:hypothetical protein
VVDRVSGQLFGSAVPLLCLIGTVAAVLVCVGLATVPRLLAHREARPVKVAVSGVVPAVSLWLPKALEDFATAYGGTSDFSDDVRHGELSGHQGKVDLPAQEMAISVALQAHKLSERLAVREPLLITVALSQSPMRSGRERLMLGRVPTRRGLLIRSRCCTAIRDQARLAGAAASFSTPMTAEVAARLGVVLLVMAIITGLVPAATTLAGELGAPASTPSRPPILPAGAKECPVPRKPGKAPTRAAVTKGTSCAFAEVVRGAYLEHERNVKKVLLKNLKDPGSGKGTIMTCKSGAPIICEGGKKTVYLY